MGPPSGEGMGCLGQAGRRPCREKRPHQGWCDGKAKARSVKHTERALTRRLRGRTTLRGDAQTPSPTTFWAIGYTLAVGGGIAKTKRGEA